MVVMRGCLRKGMYPAVPHRGMTKRVSVGVGCVIAECVAHRIALAIALESRGGWAMERPVHAPEYGSPLDPKRASCGCGEEYEAEAGEKASGEEKRSMRPEREGATAGRNEGGRVHCWNWVPFRGGELA